MTRQELISDDLYVALGDAANAASAGKPAGANTDGFDVGNQAPLTISGWCVLLFLHACPRVTTSLNWQHGEEPRRLHCG
jgi:hypothetical protein